MSTDEHYGVPNGPPRRALAGLSSSRPRTRETVAQQPQHQSVAPIESSIPLGMTCDAWPRWRSPRLRRRQLPRAALSCWATRPAARRWTLPPLPREHHSLRPRPEVLSFLVVCRVCGIEKLVHRQAYEPASSLIPPAGSRREAIGFAGQQQPNAPIKPGPGGSRSWPVRWPARGGNGCRAW